MTTLCGIIIALILITYCSIIFDNFKGGKGA
jgi:hypothetical protein